MREDYLWDKTGSDPEIERLEHALRAFSYEESAQPVLPVVVVPEKRWFGFRFAPFVFAMAACLAIAGISWSVWTRVSNLPPAGDQAAASIPNTDKTPVSAPHKPVPPYSGDIDPPKAAGPDHFAKVSTRPSKIRRNRTVLRTIPAQSKPEFTKEEIYAYDQLMLALSITSDKLGQVREKAIGE
jgi:hypothetical protein